MSLAHAVPAREPKAAAVKEQERLHALVTQVAENPDTLQAAEEALSRILDHQQTHLRRLTQAELAALERMGVSPDALSQPTSLPASHEGALERRDAEVRSYTATEVALLLGVTPARVRQRAAEGSLLARRQSDGWHFPSLQFPEGRELDGWSAVARSIPAGVPLVTIDRTLHASQPQLEIDGRTVSPMEWLSQGGDQHRAAQAVADSLTRLP